jgi:alkylhydroperoxidase family enzyme
MTMTPTRGGVESRVRRLSVEEASAQAGEAGMDRELTNIHLFQVLYQSPSIGFAVNGAKDAALRQLELDPRIREMIIMRIAWLLGAEYVWNHHVRPHVEHDLDLFRPEVLEVRDWRRSSSIGPAQRAALAVTDEIALEGGARAETVAACRAELGDRQTVEVVGTAALYYALATAAVSLGVPMEASYGFWEPDGVAPPEWS